MVDDTKLILKKCADSSQKIKNSKKYHEVNQKQQKNRVKKRKALCCYNHRIIKNYSVKSRNFSI